MIRKFTLAALILGVTSSAYAVNPGFYLGGQLGQSKLGTSAQTLQANSTSPTEQVSPTSTGPGMRLSMGYSFNPYFSFEGGYTYYSPARFNGNTASGKAHVQALDALGKLGWPIAKSGVSIFGKAGAALVSTSESGVIISNRMHGYYGLPTYGAGVSYDLTQHWVADLSYMTIPKAHSFTGASLMSLGISYHFVDEYCGQFLC